ncbi:hypothetical protein [Saccharomonospora sp.]|uniref:hypothetical protein n=1 Tax=Saccharomonospora sp. TaxID=33913 RepID=UPI00260A127D|nr:hypothetical protein [Saccharomonospora sp.]
MTDERRGHGEAVGPPWSVDVLADLHAGVLDEQESAELWPRVNADPEARAIIEALESTKADLSGFAALDAEPMPAEVADRIDAALEQQRRALQQASPPPAQPAPPRQEASQGSNVVSLDAARARRNKRLGWGLGLLTAAAVVIAAAVVVVPNMSSTSDTPELAEPAVPQSSQAGGTPPLAVNSSDLGAAIGEVSNVRDYGPLKDEQRLDACLAANGIDPAVKPVGFRPVTIDGQEAVLVLLTTGKLSELRMLALAPGCGPDNPGLLMDETVGGQS